MDLVIKPWFVSHLCLHGMSLVAYATVYSLEDEVDKLNYTVIEPYVRSVFRMATKNEISFCLKNLVRDNWLKYNERKRTYSINYEEISRACV